MKARLVVLSVLVAACLLLGAGIVLAQEPADAPAEEPGVELEGAELSAAVGTGFTYQGRLLVSGRPADGEYDFRFNLFLTDLSPALVLAADTVEDVSVTDGTFTTVVDFGVESFPGSARWIGIGVRPGDSTGDYTNLSPRQQLRPVPYAMGLAWPVTGTISSTIPLLTLENTGSGAALQAYSATDTAIAAESAYQSGGMILDLFGPPATIEGRATLEGLGVRGVANTGVAVSGDLGYSGGDADLFQGRRYTGNLFGPWDVEFRVTYDGEVTADGGFVGGDADVAEFIDASAALEPGDVVEIDPNSAGQYRLAQSASSTLVAGVISTDPGVSLGAQGGAEGEDTRPQLALAGTVPVKVCDENGPIQPGDLLVASSTPRRAMAAPADPAVGTVIGKALGSLESGEGTIDMLVMLR